jgi:chorismate mutase
MTADPHQQLLALRRRMDAMNLRLLAALQERARLCHEIAQHKIAHGMVLRDPAREDEMLQSLLREPGPGFDREALTAILQAVFDASRGLVLRGGEDPAPPVD